MEPRQQTLARFLILELTTVSALEILLKQKESHLWVRVHKRHFTCLRWRLLFWVNPVAF